VLTATASLFGATQSLSFDAIGDGTFEALDPRPEHFMIKSVNAGAKMHRRAGIKMHQSAPSEWRAGRVVGSGVEHSRRRA